MRTIEIYLGLGSRYSYLAFTQLNRIERTHGCQFELYPLSSVELLQIRGRSPFDGVPRSGQYDWDYRRSVAEAWAALYEVSFVEPERLPDDHRLMARACWAAHEQGHMRDYCGAIFRSVFADGDSIDASLCIALARSLKLDADYFARTMSGDDCDRHVTDMARRAGNRGVFGVPTCLFGDRLFWGNDRLVLLEHCLAQAT